MDSLPFEIMNVPFQFVFELHFSISDAKLFSDFITNVLFMTELSTKQVKYLIWFLQMIPSDEVDCTVTDCTPETAAQRNIDHLYRNCNHQTEAQRNLETVCEETRSAQCFALERSETPIHITTTSRWFILIVELLTKDEDLYI